MKKPLRDGKCNKASKADHPDTSLADDLREKLAHARARSQRMEMALKAVLLWHQGRWDDQAKFEWDKTSRELLGFMHTDSKGDYIHKPPYEATTRILCDMVRAALKEEA